MKFTQRRSSRLSADFRGIVTEPVTRAVAEMGVMASQCFDVTFDSDQCGGNGADGIAFAPSTVGAKNSLSSAAIGQTGGAPGHSTSSDNSGLTNGYRGIGLHAYSNFSSSGSQDCRCATSPGWQLPDRSEITTGSTTPLSTMTPTTGVNGQRQLADGVARFSRTSSGGFSPDAAELRRQACPGMKRPRAWRRRCMTGVTDIANVRSYR